MKRVFQLSSFVNGLEISFEAVLAPVPANNTSSMLDGRRRAESGRFNIGCIYAYKDTRNMPKNKGYIPGISDIIKYFAL